MKEIFQEIARLCQRGETFALATVVGTSGSTPRNMGAKFLVYPDGKFLGSVGGGCVEAEIWQEAKNVINTGRSVVKDFVLDDELTPEAGLVCGGTMEILIETTGDQEKFLHLAREINDALEGKRAPLALTTVVSSSNESLPIGAKVLMEDSGSILLDTSEALSQETSLIEVILGAFSTYEPKRVSVRGDELYVEVFRPLETILMVGAGHIAKALCSIAKFVGFRVVVVDDREEFANRERFPEADEVIVAPIIETLKEFPILSHTFVVIATRGHKLDYEALREVVEFPSPYIGVIGSKRKAHLTHQQLEEEKIPPEKLTNLHIPVGLSLGAKTPEEIALSIISEILMEKYRADGKSLRLIPEVVSGGKL